MKAIEIRVVREWTDRGSTRWTDIESDHRDGVALLQVARESILDFDEPVAPPIGDEDLSELVLNMLTQERYVSMLDTRGIGEQVFVDFVTELVMQYPFEVSMAALKHLRGQRYKT